MTSASDLILCLCFDIDGRQLITILITALPINFFSDQLFVHCSHLELLVLLNRQNSAKTIIETVLITVLRLKDYSAVIIIKANEEQLLWVCLKLRLNLSLVYSIQLSYYGEKESIKRLGLKKSSTPNSLQLLLSQEPIF